jgi:hypothetical protein
MIYEWIGRNRLLQYVVEHVELFFGNRHFAVATEETNNKWTVSAVRTVENQTYTISARIYGTPSDFFVEFDNKNQGQLFGKFANVFVFFGLGVLARRELGKDSFLESLEREFWDYLEAFLDQDKRPHQNQASTKA